MNQQYTPGPNLLLADSVVEEAPPKKRMPPADMPLPERLRLYSPTSGYARYTTMAADRIDELNGICAAQQSSISRLKRILEERNYRVHALTIANEHHQANEAKLLESIASWGKTYRDLDEDYQNLMKDAYAMQEELDASKRGLFQTIIHYFWSKK